MVKKVYILPIMLGIVVSTIFLASLQGQTSKEVSCPTPEPKKSDVVVDEIKKTFPLVEYLSQVAATSSRKAKSEKYNRGVFSVLDPNIAKDIIVSSSLDWATSLSPLPVEKSEIIIIGEVDDAQAYLSENKESVYSEFNIKIEKVLKNKEPKNFEEDNSIKVERQGGVVRFPNNHTTWFFVEGQNMPKIKRKYVFFITKEFPWIGRRQNDFYLLTAYELKDGKIFPLDNPDGGTHPIATLYKGADESVFLTELTRKTNASESLPK